MIHPEADKICRSRKTINGTVPPDQTRLLKKIAVTITEADQNNTVS